MRVKTLLLDPDKIEPGSHKKECCAYMSEIRTVSKDFLKNATENPFTPFTHRLL